MVLKKLLFLAAAAILATIAPIQKTEAASLKNDNAIQNNTEYVFLNSNNTINICRLNEKFEQICKNAPLPNITGKTVKIEQIAPISGSDISWLNFSIDSSISICAEKEEGEKIICSKLNMAKPDSQTTTSLSKSSGKEGDNIESRNSPTTLPQPDLGHKFSEAAMRISARLAGTLQPVASLGTGGYCDGGFEEHSGWDDCPADSPYGGAGGTTEGGGYGGTGGYGDGPFTPPRVDPVCAAAALKALNATVAICQRFLIGEAQRECINGANAAYINDYISCIVN